jgi:hypothetical protein
VFIIIKINKFRIYSSQNIFSILSILKRGKIFYYFLVFFEVCISALSLPPFLSLLQYKFPTKSATMIFEKYFLLLGVATKYFFPSFLILKDSYFIIMILNIKIGFSRKNIMDSNLFIPRPTN